MVEVLEGTGVGGADGEQVCGYWSWVFHRPWGGSSRRQTCWVSGWAIRWCSGWLSVGFLVGTGILFLVGISIGVLDAVTATDARNGDYEFSNGCPIGLSPTA